MRARSRPNAAHPQSSARRPRNPPPAEDRGFSFLLVLTPSRQTCPRCYQAFHLLVPAGIRKSQALRSQIKPSPIRCNRGSTSTLTRVIVPFRNEKKIGPYVDALRNAGLDP